MRINVKILLAVCLLSSGVNHLAAQKWEFAAGAGGSFYKGTQLGSGALKAATGVENGYTATAAFGHNMYRLVGGEIRYAYGQGDLKLGAGATKVTFAARSQSVHYDLLIHLSDTEARVRPFVAFGGGVKFFTGTGAEHAFQPLSNIALLTAASDTKGLISVGGGVKVKVSRNIFIRADVRDYISQFPRKLIVPMTTEGPGDWLHDFVTTLSVGVAF